MTSRDVHAPAGPPHLSVVLVTFNSRDDVERCLDSLFAELSLIGPSEVIIVDNASEDGTAELVRRKAPMARTIALDSNIGFAAAANKGAFAASGEFLLFLNPDVVLLEGAVRSLLKHVQHSSRNQIVGPQFRFLNGDAQPSFFREPTFFRLALELFLPYRVALPLLTEQPLRSRKVGALSGACMMMTRKTFEALGGFDERFFLYSEDFDLCIRARRLGIDVIALPEGAVVHALGSSAWKNPEAFYYHYYLSKILFARKHFGFLGSTVAPLFVVTGLFLRLFGYACMGALPSRSEYRVRGRALARAVGRLLRPMSSRPEA